MSTHAMSAVMQAFQNTHTYIMTPIMDMDLSLPEQSRY